MDLKNTWIGDANLDGEFSSSDFVLVFQGGKFNQDVEALWHEGDWNGDLRFDTADFVAAFAGHCAYEGCGHGPRPPVVPVPEPAVGVLISLAALCVGARRERSTQSFPQFKWRRRSGELLERRYCLSAIAFVESDIDPAVELGYLGGIHAADLDGDGDMDVLSAGSNGIVWYENIDASGTFGERQVISADESDRALIHAADLDGDGDTDILISTSIYEEDFQRVIQEVSWFENTDGSGTFDAPRQISTQLDWVQSIQATDLDGDHDLDVLVGSRRDGVVWFENTNGAGDFSNQWTITTQRADCVYTADLDRDEDVDVLVANGAGTFWFEKLDGVGAFGEEKLVYQPRYLHSACVHAGDFDADGDIDVLSGWKTEDTAPDGGIAWNENTNGNGEFGQTHLITEPIEPMWFFNLSIFAVDLDRDRDVDVLLSSPGDRTISWFENTDGRGNFGAEKRILEFEKFQFSWLSIFPSDLDGDGDQDVLFSSSSDTKIAWYENRLIGDVNDDGVFNSRDLVQVFQHGKYDDGICGNATFDEVDWNGDGDFDSKDLITAFEAGHYLVS
jgi:hypothetical protein